MRGSVEARQLLFMRPFLIALTMTAFAANSILNRMAVDGGHADSGSFATLRVLSGAVMLVVLALMQGKPLVFASRQRVLGAAMLALYMAGFSVAYRTLNAGLGALILFGSVQITMFAGALIAREAVPGRRWAGCCFMIRRSPST